MGRNRCHIVYVFWYHAPLDCVRVVRCRGICSGQGIAFHILDVLIKRFFRMGWRMTMLYPQFGSFLIVSTLLSSITAQDEFEDFVDHRTREMSSGIDDPIHVGGALRYC